MKTTSILLFVCSFFFCQPSDAQSVKQEYLKLIEEIKMKQEGFTTNYNAADSIQKKAIITKARNYLQKIITSKVFPFWYDTPWDFNGTTRIPKEGKIACGYFVTNILTDVGFDIPRVKWAQSASEVFIKKLAPNHLKRFTNKPISKVEDYLLASGEGVYLVGLDNHTGFITVINKKVRFVHADYYEPEKGVVSEELDSHSPINHSKYRVVGKLFSDEMIRSWIQKKSIR